MLTVVRRTAPALPWWRTGVVDSVLYSLVLLAVSMGEAVVDGDEVPVDSGFVQMIFGLFTLQIPAALLLCAWRSGHLAVVLRRPHDDAAAAAVRGR
ncbi:hypothetical protein [Streptomyces sp. ODS28]|uniref:hypothetical protein n=1 Tax=Streptomyces sp. ODS28 TaxID=3136688 RepID=UPI0031EF7DDB